MPPQAQYKVHAISGIEFAIQNLIENTIVHNTSSEPIVEISATRDEGDVFLEIADNGDGIPEHERKVVERESENRLEHGNGIGMWVVCWIGKRSRGELHFEESELGGASVKIQLSEY